MIALVLAVAFASTIDQILADLIEVEKHLRDGNDAAAARTGLVLRQRCAELDERMHAMIAPRLMRAIGAGVYLSGAHDEGRDWMRLASQRDPNYAYSGRELPEHHPLRSLDLSGPITTSLPEWTRPKPQSPWRDPAQMSVERPYCGRDGFPEEKPYRLVWKYEPAVRLRLGRVRYAGTRVVLDPSGEPYRWVCPPGWDPER